MGKHLDCCITPFGRVRNEKIDNHEISPLLFQPVGHIKVFFYVPIKLIYLLSIRREWQLFYAGNRKKLRALQMKHGFLPILGIYSQGVVSPLELVNA